MEPGPRPYRTVDPSRHRETAPPPSANRGRGRFVRVRPLIFQRKLRPANTVGMPVGGGETTGRCGGAPDRGVPGALGSPAGSRLLLPGRRQAGNGGCFKEPGFSAVANGEVPRVAHFSDGPAAAAAGSSCGMGQASCGGMGPGCSGCRIQRDFLPNPWAGLAWGPERAARPREAHRTG